MKKSVVKRTTRLLSLILALLLLASSAVSAVGNESIQPRASDYLDSYQAYIYPAGGGELQIWFSVTADHYMDDLGALYIYLYESTDGTSNWTYVETFSHVDNPNMLLENDVVHMDHVTYQGVKGRYYKAYVCIWAGKDGGGDTRYFWTSVKKAT